MMRKVRVVVPQSLRGSLHVVLRGVLVFRDARRCTVVCAVLSGTRWCSVARSGDQWYAVVLHGIVMYKILGGKHVCFLRFG